MAADISTSRSAKSKSRWLLIALFIASSFAFVFISAEAALLSETGRVINANMLAESRVSYDLGLKGQIEFAPLDPHVILEATHDAQGLRITPSTPDPGGALVLIPMLPDTATPFFTTAANTATQTEVPQATFTRNPPSDTPVLPSATTRLPASETPLPPTQTNTPTPEPIPPTQTPIPPTKKPKAPTDTPLPPTPTHTHTNTSTSTVTYTPLPSLSATSTASNTPPVDTETLTPTDTPEFSLTPSLEFTSEPTLTFTPIPPPTDTPVPPYRSIRPILECVQDNGDGTFTAYFGYNNRNSYDVSIPIGHNNSFFPNPIDRGQPKKFITGRHTSVFDVQFDIALAWFLDGNLELAFPVDDCP